MTTINQFVEDNLGIKALHQLKNMQKGDKSNKKGHVYEKHFTIYKLVCLTLHIKQNFPKDNIKNILKNIRISNSDYAYVDDLCIQYLTENKKLNYQLKNSSQTGKWNQDLQQQFQNQAKLDLCYHKTTKTEQILVCSNEQLTEKNNKSISLLGDKYTFRSEFFPYLSKIDEIIMQNPLEFKTKLEKLCLTPGSNLSTALEKLNSILQKDEDFNYDLCTIWEEAIAGLRPNIFSVFLDEPEGHFPDWFTDACEHFSVKIKCTTTSYSLSAAGFDIHLNNHFFEKINKVDKKAFSGVIEFISFILPLNSPDETNTTH